MKFQVLIACSLLLSPVLSAVQMQFGGGAAAGFGMGFSSKSPNQFTFRPPDYAPNEDSGNGNDRQFRPILRPRSIIRPTDQYQPPDPYLNPPYPMQQYQQYQWPPNPAYPGLTYPGWR